MRMKVGSLFCLLLVVTAIAQTKPATKPKPPGDDQQKFGTDMQSLRDTWVQEFNAGHGDKVGALYAPEAVLMRWDGSVHGKDSILAELDRSIRAGTHGYTLNSLHAERSGDLGYDTGAYDVTLRDRVVEGNYLIVVKNFNGRWLIVAHSSVPNPQAP